MLTSLQFIIIPVIATREMENPNQQKITICNIYAKFLLENMKSKTYTTDISVPGNDFITSRIEEKKQNKKTQAAGSNICSFLF